MRFSDHMLPGGSLEWSHFQCSLCKQLFVGYSKYSDHKCKPATGKDMPVNRNDANAKVI
jgi:hypothetical protein